MYEIFVDSAANLPAVDVKKYGIHVISFVNYVDGKSVVNFNPDLTLEEERKLGKEFYDYLGNVEDIVKIDEEGNGEFSCKDGSVSVWIELSQGV